MRASHLFKHLNDRELIENLIRCAAAERCSTAELVALIAEVDERHLHVPAGYASMFAYCVEVLRLSEDAAYKRIRAARAARVHPEIFERLTDGRLSLTAVTLLAPHLTDGSGAELLEAAKYMGKAQVEQLLADRFPRPDVPTRLKALPSRMAPPAQLVPEPVENAELAPKSVAQLVPEPVLASQLAPGPPAAPTGPVGPIEPSHPATVKPLAPQRYALQLTVDQEFRDLLQEAQEFLSHTDKNEIADVLKRGLKGLVHELRRRKCGATEKPRAPRGIAPGSRTIPAHVRRVVWKRDQGRCTFVGDNGRRCESRRFLEFDHIEPFACTPDSTVRNLRLRCRAHNQLEADRAFGAAFMNVKRRK